MANAAPTAEAAVDVAAPQESAPASFDEVLDVPVDASGGDTGGGDAQVPAEAGVVPDSTTPPGDPRTPLTNMMRSWVARRQPFDVGRVTSAIQGGLSPGDKQIAPATLLEIALLYYPSRVRS